MRWHEERGGLVHPRSRGAAGRILVPMFFAPGPSPLTRGSLEKLDREVCALGSIPAHAGQPSRGRTSALVPGVHPRSRGAAEPKSVMTRYQVGPSPLTRGSLRELHTE